MASRISGHNAKEFGLKDQNVLVETTEQIGCELTAKA